MTKLDVTLHGVIDAVSDRFERAWVAGERPSLEGYLEGHDESVRPELLRELLAIELQYLSQSGTAWDVADYHRRFPNETAIVDEVVTSRTRTESHSTGGDATGHAAKPSAKVDADDSLERLVGQKIGRYEIRKRLGQGGMGIVFQAWHPVMDRLVALKLLPPSSALNRTFMQRFRREVQTVAKLSHPNIVAAQDADEADGHHFLVMEFVAGRDLSAVVKQDGPLAVEQAVEFVRQAALGLEYAHKKGVIHRDIKPSNLMLTDDGVIKVLDLGLARLGNEPSEPVVKGELTDSNQMLGTPDYMAPEQWEDAHQVDHRCDLYSLGCTLFYLLTGHAPYSTEQHRTMPRKMFGHTLEPTPDLPATFPPDLSAIYKRLMAKKPEDRFASANELAQALAKMSPVAALVRVRGERINRVLTNAATKTRTRSPNRKRPCWFAKAIARAMPQAMTRPRWSRLNRVPASR